MEATISLVGCDDHTKVTMEVTEVELEFLMKLRLLLSRASNHGCMPYMEVNGEDAEEATL